MKELIMPENLKPIQGCIYKIWYGDYYIVVMANQLEWSITSIKNDLNRFKKGVGEGKSETNLYLKFYHYVLDNPGYDFRIEVVLVSDSQYQLLKHCQIWLKYGENDARCLNSKHTPYINKNFQNNRKEDKEGKVIRKGHITRGTILNFLKWKKKMYPTLI